LRQTGVNILANDIMIFETFCVCGRTVVSVDLPSSVIGQVIGQLYVFLVEFCDALNLIKLFISPPRWSHAIGAICLSVCLSLSFFLSLCLSVCLSVLSVCDQDNSRTCLRTSTKHGRHCQGDDPLEAFKFWCWSESGCKVMLAFPRLLTLQDMTWYDILSLVRGRYSTSLRQCSDFGGVCALWACLVTVWDIIWNASSQTHTDMPFW